MIWGMLAMWIVILAGVAAVVKYTRGAAEKSAALTERTAELDSERERVRQIEAAEAEARKSRRSRLDAKAARVTSGDDAARLLRELTGADDPEVN